MKKKNLNIAMRVSIISIIINVILSVLKLLAGIFSNSGAMISDAIHSASDVFSTFIVMIGVTISSKRADKDHQYGHERMESIASIVLAVILFITGVKIGFSGIDSILKNDCVKTPGVLALMAAIISIITKEWMYWYTIGAAKKIKSDALVADAWHHRSDALSSVGALIGIIGSRIGFPILDKLASVVICIFIIKTSYDIFRESTDKLVDKAVDESITNNIKDIITSTKGVEDIDSIKTRMFGSKIYVDVEFCANENLLLKDAHAIAQRVHDNIESNISDVKHCMVHVNPIKIKTK